MDSHVCEFSIIRLRSQYKGTAYEVSECEECGALALIGSPGLEARLVSKDSAEFHEVIDLMDFVIRALKK